MSFLVLFILVLVFLNSLVSYREAKEIILSKSEVPFDLGESVIFSDSMNQSFPEIAYCSSRLTCTNKHLVDDLIFVKENSNNFFSIYQNIADALTVELEKRYDPGMNLDSLNMYLNWAIKIDHASRVLNNEEKIVFSVISDYWISRISEKLEMVDDKYDFRYRSMVQKCSENSYNAVGTNSKFEKVIYNLMDNNYSYIVNRIWIGTGIITKIILLFMIIIFIFVVVNGVIRIKEKYYEKN